MSERQGYESPGIAGSGAIATGLAAVSTTTADTILLARSEASAWRAEEKVVAACAKIEGAEPSRLRVTTDPKDLADCDVVVEAIVEELDAKAELIKTLDEACPDADLATTTSSLGDRRHLRRGRRPDASTASTSSTRCRGWRWSRSASPTAPRRPASGRWPGARRSARPRSRSPTRPASSSTGCSSPTSSTRVRLMERTGMEAGEVDTCMKLGAGHPMGPLALLDFVGLDVAEAIGDALFADSADPAHKPPGLIVEMIGEEKLGRKSGAGFYSYD